MFLHVWGACLKGSTILAKIRSQTPSGRHSKKQRTRMLCLSQPHSWVISAMAFRHQKATQISKNYESRTSQKPAQQERRQRMEFYERRISPKVGDHEFGGRTWNFKRTTKTANIPGIPKRGAREAKKPDGILQNHVKPQNKGDDHKIWKQKSFHVCEDWAHWWAHHFKFPLGCRKLKFKPKNQH